jgi:hypothetical protein
LSSPAVTAFPPATRPTASIVRVSKACGTAPEAACCDHAAATEPADTPATYRVMRWASIARPRLNRLATVASFTRSCWATSRRVLFCSAQRTTAVRYFSGRPFSSRSRCGSSSELNPSSGGSVTGSGIVPICFSREERLTVVCLALQAVLYATPYSQLASRSRGQIDDGLRSKTRKVA